MVILSIPNHLIKRYCKFSFEHHIFVALLISYSCVDGISNYIYTTVCDINDIYTTVYDIDYIYTTVCDINLNIHNEVF